MATSGVRDVSKFLSAISSGTGFTTTLYHDIPSNSYTLSITKDGMRYSHKVNPPRADDNNSVIARNIADLFDQTVRHHRISHPDPAVIDMRMNSIESIRDVRALIYQADKHNRRTDAIMVTPEQNRIILQDATIGYDPAKVSAHVFGKEILVERLP